MAVSEELRAQVAADVKAWRQRKAAGAAIHARISREAIEKDTRLLVEEGPRDLGAFAALNTTVTPVTEVDFQRLAALLQHDAMAREVAIRAEALCDDALQEAEAALSKVEASVPMLLAVARAAGVGPAVLRMRTPTRLDVASRVPRLKGLARRLRGVLGYDASMVEPLGVMVHDLEASLRKVDEPFAVSETHEGVRLQAETERAGAYALMLERVTELAAWADAVTWSEGEAPRAYRLPAITAARRSSGRAGEAEVRGTDPTDTGAGAVEEANEEANDTGAGINDSGAGIADGRAGNDGGGASKIGSGASTVRSGAGKKSRARRRVRAGQAL